MTLKARVSQKLKDYKASIGRVASMITDVERTRFVVVGIAEYLSISESRRLLGELDRFGVRASHIVVNQLVLDYMEDSMLEELRKMTEGSPADSQKGIVLRQALSAARLTTARRGIQRKYLQ